MRKIFALAMVAMLSLTIAIAVMGCGQKTEQTSTESSTPPAEQTTPPADSGSSMTMDSTHSMTDTTAHK
jgi:hypothetical protein